MKFDRSKEIEQYIKSLDECEAFDRVKVVSIEKFDRFDRYTVGIYLNDRLHEIASISVKSDSIVTNEEFESQIKLASSAAEMLKSSSNALQGLNQSPKEITTCVTGKRKDFK